MTALLCMATVVYFAAALAAVAGAPIPFQVFLWAGLILISGWYVHDTIRERMEVGQGADRTV